MESHSDSPMPTDDFKGLPMLPRAAYSLDLHDGFPTVAYSAQQMYDFARASQGALLAELDRVRGDAERLDYLESMIQLGKLEIARSLLGAGYEFGHWVITKGLTVQVHSGSLRAAIDAARGKGKEGG